MYFHFGTRKIVEAAAVLLRDQPHRRLSMLRVLKLLYIADRQSLEERGRPIIGTKTVAMDYGPLHSEVYDLAKGTHWEQELWSQFIRREVNDLVLEHDPGQLKLSYYEVSKLLDVMEANKSLNDWELVVKTHKFEEWEKYKECGTSVPIPLEDIVVAVGRKEDLDDILEDAKESLALHKLFGGKA